MPYTVHDQHQKTPQGCQAIHCGVATATLQFFILQQFCVAGILLYGNSRKHA
jgi:hypothetical protein